MCVEKLTLSNRSREAIKDPMLFWVLLIERFLCDWTCLVPQCIEFGGDDLCHDFVGQEVSCRNQSLPRDAIMGNVTYLL